MYPQSIGMLCDPTITVVCEIHWTHTCAHTLPPDVYRGWHPPTHRHSQKLVNMVSKQLVSVCVCYRIIAHVTQACLYIING